MAKFLQSLSTVATNHLNRMITWKMLPKKKKKRKVRYHDCGDGEEKDVGISHYG